VDVTFGEAALAAVCNSKHRMVRRWGLDGFEYVGRRLLELNAAADLDQVGALPGAALTGGEGDHVMIRFDRDRVVIRAQVVGTPRQAAGEPNLGSHGLHIVSLEVRPRAHRQ
jgi:hypothetical protein